MTKLLFHKKDTTKEKDIIEQKIWKVDKSKHFPQGIKYSLVYIHKNKRMIGYDNERAKGHHKHYLDKEQKYNFKNLEQLQIDFTNDIKKLKELLYGNQKN
ncbi:hypothetical protein CL618_00615 [archaeon]|nr:hypothetical protein [archaeon]|tara:strand:- start:5472 stop:5771 length:300 start_codon:yes stop_codon:yes gene_type:complete